MSGKHLSRRTFLRGGAVCIGLPLLDAMTPAVARAQSAAPSRFVATYMGTCTGGPSLTNPAATGPFTAPLPASFAALQPVAQHVTILSNMAFPVYNGGAGALPTAPASALVAQHGGTLSPLCSGVTAVDGVAPNVRGHTSDQLAADFLGAGSKFASLQLRVQAASYNGRTGAAAQTRGMSVRKVGTTLSELLPIESPSRIFGMLFTGGTTTPPTMPPPGSPGLPSKRKSVLDLVLADANRLTASVGGEDRARLDQHFTYIRDLERSLPGPVMPGDAGTTTTPMTGSCGTLANPGPDPAISTYGFGGWANETARGSWMADAIAYAFACDLTRSVSWMLTHDQCWLNSVQTSGSTFVSPDGVTEIHSDSHNATADIRAKNANWGAALWSRLISNLAARQEASGTVLDRTFLSFVFAEGTNAHNKQTMTHLVAGYPSRVRNGVHLATGGLNPALVGLTGLKAIGMPVTQFGEISGAIPGLLI